jgi:hypothetical protein
MALIFEGVPLENGELVAMDIGDRNGVVDAIFGFVLANVLSVDTKLFYSNDF